MAVVKAFGSEGFESRPRARGQRAAAGRGRRGRAAAGALRRPRRRRARGRHRARARRRRAARRRRRDRPGRADRVRQLHAQGAQPDAQHRPRGDQDRGGDGASAERVAELLAEDDVLAERAGRVPRRPRARATSRSRACRSPTARGGRRCATSRCGWRRASASRSWARRAPASRRSARSSRASTTRREGRVLIDGRDARDCSLAWLREQVAIVLQDTVLFTGTVRENIAYATDATRERGRGGGARGRRRTSSSARCRDGYDTELGPQGVGALGRPAPAHRHRPHAAARPADPRARRADDRARRGQRGARARGPAALMRGRTTILVTHSPRLARAPPTGSCGSTAGARRSGPRATRAAQLERLLDAAGCATCSRARSAATRGSARSRSAASSTSRATRSRSTTARRRRRAPRRRRDAHRRRRPRRARTPPRATRARAQGRARSPRRPLRTTPSRRAGHVAAVRPAAAGARRGPGELERRLGTRVGGEPELIGYKPRARAVLRATATCSRPTARARQFEAALAGLLTAARGPAARPASSPAPCRSCG